MKIEKRSAKQTIHGKEARQFHYFMTKAQCADKKVLQSNINLAARLACGITDSAAIDSIVKLVVSVSTKTKGFTEIAIYLTDSIMRHAARSEVEGILERYQKRLKPHLKNLFKRALRCQGKPEVKKKLITRLKDKILAYWQKNKWFPTELAKVSDIVQMAVKSVEQDVIPDADGPDDDDEVVEVKQELRISVPKAVYAGATPQTPMIGKAKARPPAGPFSAPFMGTAKAAAPAAPFSVKQEVSAKAGKGIPRTPAQITRLGSPASPLPFSHMPRTPATITGIPRTPVPAGAPRTPATMGVPGTTAATGVFGLPRTPRPGGDAVPPSPQSIPSMMSDISEPASKRQRLHPMIPGSPPEILHSVPKTPVSPHMLQVPQTPMPGAVPSTPMQSAMPATPNVRLMQGAVPATPTATQAVPRTPIVAAMPRTPALGAVPQTPRGGAATAAVPQTPKPTAKAAVFTVPQTPASMQPSGAFVPVTPGVAKTGAKFGAVPRSPDAVPASPPSLLSPPSEGSWPPSTPRNVGTAKAPLLNPTTPGVVPFTPKATVAKVQAHGLSGKSGPPGGGFPRTPTAPPAQPSGVRPK
eukprot:gnl/MRDRNA2_/MRDRNA2_185034_c0_seq1.p1 gnl/MRDRNA2_/MRDRNA2_185034_c0~~gnl/MRDRNA2_/MRDRNA2_185034_c0_seq1.p1  ORF type:complete len:582 (-),score=107.47 gnl/MRDRNA2_/MRDRNA2_185034_c0_seq1:42-1787(-)